MHLRASRDPLFISDFLELSFYQVYLSSCWPRGCQFASGLVEFHGAVCRRAAVRTCLPRPLHVCAFAVLHAPSCSRCTNPCWHCIFSPFFSSVLFSSPTSVLLLFILLSFPHGAQSGGSSWYLLTGTTFLQDQILDKGQGQCFQVIRVRHSGCCWRG